MNSLLSSFSAVLPSLILVSLGMLLRRKLHLEPVFWTGLEKLVYYVFFPILLADTTWRAQISAQHGTLMLMSVIIMMVGIALSWIGIKLFRAPSATQRSIFQCGFRFNTYIGIAVVSSAFGQNGVGLFALIAAVCVPIANLAAVSMLSQQNGNSVWKELMHNPLIIGTLTGIAGNLLGVELPAFLTHTFSLISHAAIVLGLIAVGAALHFESLGYYRRLVAYFLTLKLILLPIFTLLILKYVAPPMEPIAYSVIMIFTSLPTASTAFVLTMRMGGDGKTVALHITAGSILSMITIPFWMMLTPLLLP